MAGRKTARFAAKETMQRLAYDPLEEMIRMAQATDNPAVKMEVAQSLMPYMHPKLSNVEVQGEMDTTVHQPNARDMMERILANPELADAAQKLSLVASDVLNESGSDSVQ